LKNPLRPLVLKSLALTMFKNKASRPYLPVFKSLARRPQPLVARHRHLLTSRYRLAMKGRLHPLVLESLALVRLVHKITDLAGRPRSPVLKSLTSRPHPPVSRLSRSSASRLRIRPRLPVAPRLRRRLLPRRPSAPRLSHPRDLFCWKLVPSKASAPRP